MTSRCLKGNRSAELKRFQAMREACNIVSHQDSSRGKPAERFRFTDGSQISLVVGFNDPDFAALDTERTVAMLPVGAVEQHGPHLPVGVDAAINAGIVARAVELMPQDCPALVLPMTAVGKSDEHLSFPGTLTLSHETLGRVWYELGASVHRAGLRKILFFNSHGGQPQGGGNRLPRAAGQAWHVRRERDVAATDRYERSVRRAPRSSTASMAARSRPA